MTPFASDAGADRGLAALLLVASAVYLAALPLNLSIPDEAHALYEAKQLLAGDVMYRDLFTLITPGWMYLMALLFEVFGTTLQTARIAAAVVHGCTAALTFLACRQLDVRRPLAWACGSSYVVICQPAFPVASQHWLATCLWTVLLLRCVQPARKGLWCGLGGYHVAWSMVAGVLVGLCIDVHQQRGLILGLVVTAVLISEALLRSREREAPATPPLRAQLTAFGVGAVLVVFPLLAHTAVRAGVAPVWEALVIHPLVNCRTTLSCPWGDMTAGIPLPYVLRWLPAAVVLMIADGWLAYRRREWPRVRACALLITFAAGSLLSIAYYPDIIHFAFIAPVFLIALAEAVERAVQGLPAPAVAAAGWVVSLALLVAGGLYLAANLTSLRAQYPIAYASAFGRIDFRYSVEVLLYETLRALLQDVPSRELYGHRNSAYLYLLLDAKNPTRFQFVIPGSYTSPRHVREVVERLAARRVRYVVAAPHHLLQASDSISVFVREHYQRLAQPMPIANLIWQRLDAGAGR